MNFLNNTVLTDDFIWDVINSHIGQRWRGTGDAVFSIHCPMCVMRGHSPDKKHRLGVFHSLDGIGLNCFQCGFKTRFKIGRHKLPTNLKLFLEQIGVSEREVKEIGFQAHRLYSFTHTAEAIQPEFQLPAYDTGELPPGSQTIQAWHEMGCRNPDYLAVVDYLLSRGDVAATALPYYWSPHVEHDINRKLIIPGYHDNRLVGWIGRAIDKDAKRKYFTQLPRNFVFNSKALSHPFRKYLIVVEGVFDALVVDGVAVLGAALSDYQIKWINQSGKSVIVVPDRDDAGKRLAHTARQQNWAVAIPNYGGRNWWENDIKDVDEAVRRHGRLFTLQSIIASMTDNEAEILTRMELLNFKKRSSNETKI